ncbi:MAG: hypothetical protein A3G34_07065 [Candidatus Lindowbacteria bacterium RIFCSPLOWO2_12_FULL_62_27]|nr:MAG: hypothetical protein A3G34_07065 [Candidatus Lindowbacteria bacterium RIFCSPLOWO2_12_FULL_62_27]OGH61795.1 MAG: hypothetical protein A3I06_09245 [Candidatus Lindowbacteria bacterium RIFCSPLOWO2_02_FULL_62_12]
MKILAIGDVHGDFDAMVQLMEAHQPDLCLQVGDLEPVRDEEDLLQLQAPAKYRRVKSFPAYWSGEKEIPTPTIFVGGNHDVFGQLEDHDPGRKLYPYLIPNLQFLGRWGVITLYNGITVAGLSGNFSEADYDEPSARRRRRGDATGWRASRENSHFRRDEVQSLIKACRNRQVDIFLSHEWPAGLVSEEEAKRLASLWRVGAPQILSYGKDPIREIVDAVRPTYHFCGHNHRRFEGRIGRTRIVCLGIISSGADACCIIDVPQKYEPDPGVCSPLATIRHKFPHDYNEKMAKIMRKFRAGEEITDQTFLDMGLNPISTAPLEFDPWNPRKRQTRFF